MFIIPTYMDGYEEWVLVQVKKRKEKFKINCFEACEKEILDIIFYSSSLGYKQRLVA
jgi:hypothetical protein